MIIFDNLQSCTIIIDPYYYNQTAMRIKKNMRGNVRHQDKRTIYLTNIISYNQQSWRRKYNFYNDNSDSE